MQETLSVGLLGCGQATRKYHIPSINAIENLELEWVCDTDGERARSTGSEEEVDWYTDPDEALATSVDLVNINTPPHTHNPLALDALDAGSNVLLEKPAAMTVDEVDELIDAFDGAEEKICLVHNNLYFDPMLSVLEAVENRELGDVVGVRSFLGGSVTEDERDWSEESSGGPIMDRLPHPIYLVTHFLDDVDRQSINVHEKDGLIDGVSIQLEDGERFGYIEARQSAIPAKQVEIIGTKERIDVDLFNYTRVTHDTIERSPLTMVSDNVSVSYQVLRNTFTNGLDFVSDTVSEGSKFSAPGHYHLMKAFRRSIVNDTEPPIGLDEGRKVVELLNKVEDFDQDDTASATVNESGSHSTETRDEQ